MIGGRSDLLAREARRQRAGGGERNGFKVGLDARGALRGDEALPCRSATVAMAGVSETFHRRAMMPRSMPSSAGSTAQRRTLGSLYCEEGKRVGGKWAGVFADERAGDEGVLCSRANFIAATWT